MHERLKMAASLLGAASGTNSRTSVMGSARQKSGIGSALSGRGNSPNAIYQPPRAVRSPGNAPTPQTPRTNQPRMLRRTVKVPGPAKLKMSNANIGRAFVRGVRGAIMAPWRALPSSAKAGLGLTAGAGGLFATGKATSKYMANTARSRALNSPTNLQRNQLQQTFWGRR